jgi:hypothetical protein
MNNGFKKDLQELVNKYPEMKLKDIQKILQESKKPLPKTWKEAYTKYLCDTTIYYIDTNSEIQQHTKPIPANVVFNKNALLSSERAEEVLALIQLITLRDIYNNGWKPDWSNYDEPKYCIYGWSNTIDIDIFSSDHAILAFKTEELRDEFFKNFKDLIEKAKNLI